MTILTYFFVKKMSKKFDNKIGKKNIFFLQIFLKNGLIEAKAYGESKKN
jgi:hypothetical protein